MRSLIIVLVTALGLFAAAGAQAGSSCSTFAKITGYDEASKSITIDKENGSESKFFPKTEGAPNTSKIPKKCRSRVLSQDSFPVKATGGRLSITQVRANFSGKMLNDIKDDAWLPTKLKELVASGEMVVVVLRQPPGSDKKAPYGVTTVYMPITDEELAEIDRLNAQASDE
jgi:hypothetical protein